LFCKKLSLARGCAGPARQLRTRVFEITNPRRARAFRLTPGVHEVRAP